MDMRIFVLLSVASNDCSDYDGTGGHPEVVKRQERYLQLNSCIAHLFIQQIPEPGSIQRGKRHELRSVQFLDSLCQPTTALNATGHVRSESYYSRSGRGHQMAQLC